MPHNDRDAGSFHNRRVLWGDVDPVHFEHFPVFERFHRFGEGLGSFAKHNSIVVDVISVRGDQTRRPDLRVRKRLALLTSYKAQNCFIVWSLTAEHARDNSSTLPARPTGTPSGLVISPNMPSAATNLDDYPHLHSPNPPNPWNFQRIQPLNPSGRLVYEGPADYGIGW